MVRRALIAAALAAALALPAAAQPQRQFPPSALRGELVVVAPPEVQLNGKPARLSPGARIRGENNTVALSGSLVGQPLVVHYTVDGFGALKDVWVLTPSERSKLWPRSEKEAKTWLFDAETQTWTKR
jgi:hypothetical protein